MNRPDACGFAVVFSILAALAIGSSILPERILAQIGGSPQSPKDLPLSSEPIRLRVRFGDGRSTFHLGEIIPIELEFSSSERKTYRILAESQPTRVNEYTIDPPTFDRRDEEAVAAGRLTIGIGRNWPTNVDPGEKPYKLQDTLNRLFRMRTPGRYRVSVTSSRFGFPVTSTTQDLEILPSDPSWETAELKRGLELIRAPLDSPDHSRGCEIVSSLATDAAQLAMAALYAERSECEDTFAVGLINSANRTAVLEHLEKGLHGRTRSVDASFLRTLAYIRTYQQHPEWYSVRTGKDRPPDFSWRNVLDMTTAEQLRYAQLLVSALPNKDEGARAASLKTLVYLGRTLPAVEIPEQIRTAAREQMPAVFGLLRDLDQTLLLKHRWPEIRSQAMVPVLKQIAETSPSYPQEPRNIALRRLYELSPKDARPILLRELRSQDPGASVDVLGMLPEEELPELDSIALERVKERFPYGGAGLVVAAGLLRRFASPAIADSLRPLLVKDGIGKMECESEANLLAYFLRVAPPDGAAMLSGELQSGNRPGCLILRRLANVRMSPEVEAAALEALKSPFVGVVRDGLHVLQLYGSSRTKEILWSHFRDWHEAWVSRAKELERPENRERAAMDLAFFRTIGAAHGWLCSEQDLVSLKELCVTEECKRVTAQSIIYWRSWQFTIQFEGPVGDGVEERIGMGRYQGVIATMDRLQQKLVQYPKGSVFWLDTRFHEDEMADRIYYKLKSWTTQNGYDIRRMSN